MKVKISYSDKKVNKKKLYSILADVIIEDIKKKQMEDKYEKNSSTTAC